MSAVSERQPPPEHGDINVIDAVIEDFRERAQFGFRKYGTFLQACNGRDALMDAYQEAVDLVMYLKQALIEREKGCGNITSQEKNISSPG